MRIIVVAAAVAMAGGCSSYNRMHGTAFEPVGDQEFRYEANASTVDYPPDDASAEATRRQWLKQYLDDNGLCPSGYEITDRNVVVIDRALLGTGYRIFYKGRCRTA